MFLIIPVLMTSFGLVISAPGPYEDSLNLEDILFFRGSEEGPDTGPEEGSFTTLVVSQVEIECQNINQTVKPRRRTDLTGRESWRRTTGAVRSWRRTGSWRSGKTSRIRSELSPLNVSAAIPLKP